MATGTNPHGRAPAHGAQEVLIRGADTVGTGAGAEAGTAGATIGAGSEGAGTQCGTGAAAVEPPGGIPSGSEITSCMRISGSCDVVSCGEWISCTAA